MGEPARHEAADEAPPLDPFAVDRAYRAHRARRRARIEHRRSTRWARLRFWLVLVSLLVCAVALVVAVWSEVQRLFGL